MNEEKLDGLQEETLVENAESETQTEQQGFLSDNVKALSPSQLVMKRFFRSKLSIVGLVLIIGLFLFSFIGPLFSPYGETEIDYDTDRMNVVVTEFTYEVPMYDEFGQPVLDENGELQYETYTVYQMDKTAKKVDDVAFFRTLVWYGRRRYGRIDASYVRWQNFAYD